MATRRYSSASTLAVHTNRNPPSAFCRVRNTDSAGQKPSALCWHKSFCARLPNSGREDNTTRSMARLVTCSVHMCGSCQVCAIRPLASTSGRRDGGLGLAVVVEHVALHGHVHAAGETAHAHRGVVPPASVRSRRCRALRTCPAGH